jgi:hypothetical protein
VLKVQKNDDDDDAESLRAPCHLTWRAHGAHKLHILNLAEHVLRAVIPARNRTQHDLAKASQTS